MHSLVNTLSLLAFIMHECTRLFVSVPCARKEKMVSLCTLISQGGRQSSNDHKHHVLYVETEPGEPRFPAVEPEPLLNDERRMKEDETLQKISLCFHSTTLSQ